MKTAHNTTYQNTPSSAEAEIQQGKRFQFGRNWSAFLAHINEARIEAAEERLLSFLKVKDLRGLSFLDAGSGSGLMSLAARRLGARVRSFDYDHQSVHCTDTLREMFFTDDEDWAVSDGSLLDTDFLSSLGTFDLVYCWGVLHHTGHMWRALDLLSSRVRVDGGLLYVMLYPDLGWKSDVWRIVKRLYCSSTFGKFAVISAFFPYYLTRGALEDLLCMKNPTHRYKEYFHKRGMSKYHDWHDWLGGLPYEVCNVEQLKNFLGDRGFEFRYQEGVEYLFEKKP